MNRRWIILAIVLLLLAIAGTTAGVQLENRDAFCASCHTEPESTYYQRSLTLPSDLASAHAFVDSAQVRCIDCHSGIGVAGRASSLSQGAWDLVRYLSGSYQQPAYTTNPIGDVAVSSATRRRVANRRLTTRYHLPAATTTTSHTIWMNGQPVIQIPTALAPSAMWPTAKVPRRRHTLRPPSPLTTAATIATGIYPAGTRTNRQERR